MVALFQNGGLVGSRMAIAGSVAIFCFQRLVRRSIAHSRSADRHSINEAALGPQIVGPAIEFKGRAFPDIALEELAVIANRLYRVVGPFLVDAERLSHSRSDAEQPLYRGVVRFCHLVDILRA